MVKKLLLAVLLCYPFAADVAAQSDPTKSIYVIGRHDRGDAPDAEAEKKVKEEISNIKMLKPAIEVDRADLVFLMVTEHDPHNGPTSLADAHHTRIDWALGLVVTISA